LKNAQRTANDKSFTFTEHPYDNTRIRAEQKDVVTYAGNSVRLRCEMHERATIHWSREGQPLPTNARIGEDYLELTQVKPEDSGRYICQIQTSRGVSSDYINFNVSRKFCHIFAKSFRHHFIDFCFYPNASSEDRNTHAKKCFAC